MFNRLSQIPKSRAPWLLLWLVPYLFLSVAGESLHNHGFGDRQHAAHLSSALQSESQQASLQDESSTSSHVIFDADCLACHWSSFAALSPASVSHVAPSHRRVIAAASSPFVLSNDAAFVSTRGPPLS